MLGTVFQLSLSFVPEYEDNSDQVSATLNEDPKCASCSCPVGMSGNPVGGPPLAKLVLMSGKVCPHHSQMGIGHGQREEETTSVCEVPRAPCTVFLRIVALPVLTDCGPAHPSSP